MTTIVAFRDKNSIRMGSDSLSSSDLLRGKALQKFIKIGNSFLGTAGDAGLSEMLRVYFYKFHRNLDTLSENLSKKEILKIVTRSMAVFWEAVRYICVTEPLNAGKPVHKSQFDRGLTFLYIDKYRAIYGELDMKNGLSGISITFHKDRIKEKGYTEDFWAIGSGGDDALSYMRKHVADAKKAPHDFIRRAISCAKSKDGPTGGDIRIESIRTDKEQEVTECRIIIPKAVRALWNKTHTSKFNILYIRTRVGQCFARGILFFSTKIRLSLGFILTSLAFPVLIARTQHSRLDNTQSLIPLYLPQT